MSDNLVTNLEFLGPLGFNNSLEELTDSEVLTRSQGVTEDPHRAGLGRESRPLASPCKIRHIFLLAQQLGHQPGAH